MAKRWFTEFDDLLNTISIVPLGQHDFLGHNWALLDGTEANNISCARVRFFVTVGHAHTTTDSDIEPSQLAILVDDSDEAQVVCEDINIVGGRHGNCNFELDRNESLTSTEETRYKLCEEDKIRHTLAQRP
jgi:hypothetical protein